MKIRNIAIMIFVLAALSLAAYSLNKSTKVDINKDISLEDVRDCDTIHWKETADVYGTCTMNHSETVCDDPPLNTSCHVEEKSQEYSCKTGTETLQKSREDCRNKELLVTIAETKNYRIEYGDWGRCSYEKQDETLVITCDSRYDGNNDGICTPGESCIQFRIAKDKTQTLIRNSKHDFAENDETFFLEKLNLEEVGK